MSKSVAIVQSSYIPWKGFFDLINLVDEFILFDDVQFTRRDWRNRNKIKTPNGSRWLTIPVNVSGNFSQLIKDTTIASSRWTHEHWQSILHNYAQAPFFDYYAPTIKSAYDALATEEKLSVVNRHFIDLIMALLQLDTKITWSMDYDIVEGKTERLLSLCQQAGASYYLSGPSAKSYLNESLFINAGIEVSYMDYQGYPEYRQLYAPFIHEVTILDLIFNMGKEARKYMKS